MTDTPKKSRGRPKIVLNQSAILDLAAQGFSNTKIMRSLSIPANVWARRLRDEPGFRDLLNHTRATSKADILRAQKRGSIGGEGWPGKAPVGNARRGVAVTKEGGTPGRLVPPP